jgi:dihydroflavonol-4-reductase
LKSKNEKMILVTGVTGLVGGNLLWSLLQENERVVAIRRTSSNLDSLSTIFSFYTPHPDLFLDRIDWRFAELLDLKSIQAAMNDISVVYHCAAVVSLGSSSNILFDTNVIGTKNIVQASLEAGIKKLCFVSSIAACGKNKNNEIIDEDAIWIDSSSHSLYSKSKYYSELEVWKGIDEGLNAVIVNPGVILGISGTDKGSSQLFSQVNTGLIFYTNGGSGYVDVQDVVKAMIQLIKSDNSAERFILIGENCSNKQVLCWMADGFNKKRPFIKIGKKPLWLVGYLSEIVGRIFKFTPLITREMTQSITQREFYSSSKIQKVLGFKFKSIEKCINEVCEFTKKSM